MLGMEFANDRLTQAGRGLQVTHIFCAMKIKTLIVDDEPLACERYRSLLAKYPDFQIIGECGGGFEAINFIQKYHPDLVLLDVNIPDLDGISMLKVMDPESAPVTVIVTADASYAVEAFETNAVDYLLKPVNVVRFHKALDRVVTSLSQSTEAKAEVHADVMVDAPLKPQKDDGDYLSRIMVRKNGRVNIVRMSDVDWIESSGNYIRMHSGSQSYMVRDSMNGIEGKLNPAQFIRIHRSTIVNIDCIREMQTSKHGESVVLLQNGTKLWMSRRYKDRIRRFLKSE